MENNTNPSNTKNNESKNNDNNNNKETAKDMEIDEHEEYTDAIDMMTQNPQNAISIFENIISKNDTNNTLQKIKEQAIYRLGELYIKIGKVESLKNLLKNIRPFLKTIPKAKTAKIVRTLLDYVSRVKNSEKLQILLCDESIIWCKDEKRTFLRQRIESKKAFLLFKCDRFKESLDLLKNLTREVKTLDDKLLLVEIYLTESRIHLKLANISVAKSSLTSARSASNAIYCPIDLQAEVDLQSGIISAAEKDFKTSFSYFYESFEGFTTANDKENAVLALKYMLLTKILSDEPNDIYALINSKSGLKFSGNEIEAMRQIANAYQKRSLHQFQDILKTYKKELVDDFIVDFHLKRVYETLLEKNLLRIIEPYSRVEISHLAHKMEMENDFIEKKLASMILDKKLNGILDQGNGHLIVFEEDPGHKMHISALQTMKELGNVVEKLTKKAQKIHS